MQAVVVLPDQLYKNNPLITRQRVILLVEDRKYFTDYKFHKKKLVLHRASMCAYRERLESQGFKVEYINFNGNFKPEKYKKLLHTSHDEKFLSPTHWLAEHFEGADRFSFTPFYIEQRKRLKILVDSRNKPKGGKWSFDPENRQKIPQDTPIPPIKPAPGSKHVQEAIGYVNEHFPDNPGTSDDFIYPVTHEGAQQWFKGFLEDRLEFFGDYEDAIQRDQGFLFHSVTAFALNTGLISPNEVVNLALERAKDNNIGINSLEGFIRQVIGWREYIRAVFLLKEAEEVNTNFFGFDKPLPDVFYTGETGVKPVDTIVRRLLNTGYSHHIERLMVLGNFFLLCEISPHEVYRWFMEMYIDAYDWVMVPNVYGMSQFADGGLIMTKPYISSSNYIRKMSDFKHGEWCGIWDALYWRFLCRHRDYFERNPRTRLMIRTLDGKSAEQLRDYCERGDRFIEGM